MKRIALYLFLTLLPFSVFGQTVSYQIEDRLSGEVRCEQHVTAGDVTTSTDCNTKEWIGTTTEINDGRVSKMILATGNAMVIHIGVPIHRLQPGMVTSGTAAFGNAEEKLGEMSVTARAWMTGNQIVREIIFMEGQMISRFGYSTSGKFPDWAETIEKESAQSPQIVSHEFSRRIR